MLLIYLEYPKQKKIRRDKVEGAELATNYSVGKEVRNAIENIGGTMPEKLPVPEKSIQQIEKEQRYYYYSITLDTDMILNNSRTAKNRYKNN